MYSGNADLYPGSFVKVFADLGSAGKSILIPTQCIIPILKGQKVYVYRKGQLNEIKVITGRRHCAHYRIDEREERLQTETDQTG